MRMRKAGFWAAAIRIGVGLVLAFGLVLPPATALAENKAMMADAETSVALHPYELTIEFSGKLKRHMRAINRIERIQEERFRRSLSSRDESADVQGSEKPTAPRLPWAGAALIPDLHAFSVENLLIAMVEHNIARAQPDFDGSIRLKIDRIKLDDHSEPYLRASSSFVVGKIEMRTRAGEKIIEDKMTVTLEADQLMRTGPAQQGFIFSRYEADYRLAPVLALFVEQALEKAWPQKSEQIEGPIFIVPDPADVSAAR
ncbi:MULTISPECIES: hypothetical protein [unclassified Iodidimonas]|uniref:hypothetical protein n=1 Tax=unclassified Iodidimonas TaxID=2626145 RepID=UPI002482E3D6|nr:MULTISPECIES: hypothetical protein [unclassified Iodidimonas]